MSKATGRSQISAPKCTTVTQSALGGATTVWGLGNSVINGDEAIGSTAIVVAVGKGFIADQVVTIGYGTASAEDVTVDNGHTHDAGADVAVTISATANAHPAGSRIVAVTANRPLRPGSVVIENAATATIGTDDGLGVITGDSGNTTGTVDYNAGTVNLVITSDAAPTITGDVLADTADIAAIDGTGFHRNFQEMLFDGGDGPDTIIVSNLGDNAIGVIVEQTKSDGRNFEQSVPGGLADGRTANIPAFGRATIQMPGGVSTVLDGLRVRAGAASTGASSVAEVDTIRHLGNRGA